MSVLARLLPRRGGHELVVEPMKRRHLDAVLAIERVSYPKPWTLALFQSELAEASRGDRCYLVAREGSDVVAYGGVMFAAGDAHVTNIATAPAHQRRGLANRVLAELSWASIARGCEAMTLEVRASNAAAQALYAGFGFVPAGIRRKYYENTEDAIVMWCHALQSSEQRERLTARSPEASR